MDRLKKLIKDQFKDYVHFENVYKELPSNTYRGLLNFWGIHDIYVSDNQKKEQEIIIFISKLKQNHGYESDIICNLSLIERQTNEKIIDVCFRLYPKVSRGASPVIIVSLKQKNEF